LTAVAQPAPHRPTPGATSEFRDSLRGTGPTGILATLIILLGIVVAPPVGAVLILIWAWAARLPWLELGLVRPKSWLGGLAIGALLGVSLKFLMKAIVLPLLGADPINHAFQGLAGNPATALEFAAYAIVGAGIAEEIVYRGFFFERLGKFIGTGTAATALTVVLATLVFGAAHWQQGIWGIVNATGVGLVFALIFAATRRLYTLMVAHAAFDLTAGAIIYLNLEPTVAHLVFK
jgi:membrane protease YdiL (CAAX protease family)